MIENSLNVLGEPLMVCGTNPMTGAYRNGCCDTGRFDVGTHTVCAVVTDDFLTFSKSKGNDLTRAYPGYNFPGLVAGDHWCLCVPRWLEISFECCAQISWKPVMKKLWTMSAECFKKIFLTLIEMLCGFQPFHFCYMESDVLPVLYEEELYVTVFLN